MPNRILRESILSSSRVAALSFPEEVFYRRLMSIVDDYGRTEYTPNLLRSRCYPLQTDDVRAADISRWMAACQKAGLLLSYAVSGKDYLELSRFGQQTRTDSKCPPPPADASKCYQMLANDRLVGGGGECGGVCEVEVEKNGSDEPSPTVKTLATDEQWLKEIATDAAYLGVDVPREFAKMTRWCEANHKSPTRKRFINWLNRIDKPMAVKRRGSNI